MKQLIFVVKDTKADACLTPFFMRTEFEAQRAFSDAVNGSENSPLTKHPEDFVLFELGEFDVVTGRITPLDAPRSLGVGSDFVVRS